MVSTCDNASHPKIKCKEMPILACQCNVGKYFSVCRSIELETPETNRQHIFWRNFLRTLPITKSQYIQFKEIYKQYLHLISKWKWKALCATAAHVSNMLNCTKNIHTPKYIHKLKTTTTTTTKTIVYLNVPNIQSKYFERRLKFK